MREPLRYIFQVAENALDRAFGPAWNPLHQLGALGFFFYWIVAASGIYVYLFFDTGVTEAYASIEYMTNEQWYLAGVMRSLHRYASDGMVFFMVLHVLREFSNDRYRGTRWFSWVTGWPAVVLLFVCGITGYWLVWDQLAQYVAITSTEWLDWLPIFGEPIARNFMAPEMLDDRFFTVLVFIHIAAPLILLLLLWLHLNRVSRPRSNPPRGLAIGSFVMLLVLSLIKPATSQAPADLAQAVGGVGLDWFYLGFYPLLNQWPGAVTWGGMATLGLILVALPWLPPLRQSAAARVDLDNCNGCTRCAEDCPYAAISMQRRTDGKPFELEAVVNGDLCVSCGICAGACPTATPFRRKSELVPGIELPDRTIAELRDDLEAQALEPTTHKRLLVIGCDHGVDVATLHDCQTGTLSLPCIGMLPPSFIDYALSHDIADGIVLTGCADGACQHRSGVDWTKARMARERDPYLRRRVPKERLLLSWVYKSQQARLKREIETFRDTLPQTPPLETTTPSTSKRSVEPSHV